MYVIHFTDEERNIEGFALMKSELERASGGRKWGFCSGGLVCAMQPIIATYTVRSAIVKQKVVLYRKDAVIAEVVYGLGELGEIQVNYKSVLGSLMITEHVRNFTDPGVEFRYFLFIRSVFKGV